MFSARLCQLMGMPGTGGSDAHQVSDIGRCATQFFRRIESIEELIAELRAGRFRAVCLDDDLLPDSEIEPTRDELEFAEDFEFGDQNAFANEH